MDNKEKLRRQIARDTDEFLRKGGVIEVIPPVHFCPKSMEWARKRGMDYQNWDSLGSELRLGDTYWLGDGGYLTKPTPTEE